MKDPLPGTRVYGPRWMPRTATVIGNLLDIVEIVYDEGGRDFWFTRFFDQSTPQCTFQILSEQENEWEGNLELL